MGRNLLSDPPPPNEDHPFQLASTFPEVGEDRLEIYLIGDHVEDVAPLEAGIARGYQIAVVPDDNGDQKRPRKDRREFL